MKKVSMRKYSILGLVLIGASAVTAAVLPKSEPRKYAAGVTQTSAAGSVVQVTCTVNGTGLAACTVTANSATTESGVTSTVGAGVRTATVVGSTPKNNINSSKSPA